MRYFEIINEDSSAEIHYVNPDPYVEYEEALRYDILKHLTLPEWKSLIDKGRKVKLSASVLSRIGNSCATSIAAARESFSDLQRIKRHRTLAAISSGVVEYPIILKIGNALDLLAGNTRLTAIVATGRTPSALLIDVADIKSSSI